MTEDFNFDRSRAGGGGSEEYFSPRDQQGHLFIMRVFDCVAPVRTSRCPTGYVTRNGQTYPNNAVRAAVVDMNQHDEHGGLGKMYPEAMIFSGLLVKELKRDVGKTILITWNQQDRNDKSSPYTVTEMAGNDQAVAAARDYLNRHPEFMQLSPPPEWKIEMSPPVQEQQQWNQQQNWGNGLPQGYGPPQQGWNNSPQGYGPPQNYGPPPQQNWQQPPPQQQPQWQQPPQNQWQQLPPQQGWQQDQGYNQHPPRQQQAPGGWQQPPAPQGPPQGAPGSFLEAYAQQRGQQPQNHWGQPQSEEPPY